MNLARRIWIYAFVIGVLAVGGFWAGSAQFAYQYCGSVTANCGIEAGYRGALWALGAIAIGLFVAVAVEYRVVRRRNSLGSSRR